MRRKHARVVRFSLEEDIRQLVLPFIIHPFAHSFFSLYSVIRLLSYTFFGIFCLSYIF